MIEDYNLPTTLAHNVDNIGKAVQQKLQRVIFIDGEQRSGKSNLAKAMAGKLAKFLGVEFNVNHIFFDVYKINSYLGSTKGKIVILDEAAFDLMSTDWQKKDQQLFLKMLYTAAKNHHTLFILIPELSALSYKIVANGHGLFRTYMRRSETGYFTRGYFACYTKKAIKTIYFIEKNKLNKKLPHVAFRGRCPDVTTKSLVVDEAAYERNKDNAIGALTKDDNEPAKPDIWMQRFCRLHDRLVEKKVLPSSRILEEYAGVNHQVLKKARMLYGI